MNVLSICSASCAYYFIFFIQVLYRHGKQITTRMGGLGLRSCTKHRNTALLGSLGLVKDTCVSLWRDYKCDLSSQIQETLNKELPDSLKLEGTYNPQRFTSARLDQVTRDKLLEEATPTDKKRLLSLTMPKASAWLQCPDEECYIGSDIFRIACGLRLGTALFSEDEACRACKKTQDAYGYHASVCIDGRDIHRRHDKVREEFIGICRSAGLATMREPKYLVGYNKQRPADWYCPQGLSEGASRNYNKPGQAASDAEAAKSGKYSTLCAKYGINFSPIALEVYGGLGPQAVRTLSRLS